MLLITLLIPITLSSNNLRRAQAPAGSYVESLLQLSQSPINSSIVSSDTSLITFLTKHSSFPEGCDMGKSLASMDCENLEVGFPREYRDYGGLWSDDEEENDKLAECYEEVIRPCIDEFGDIGVNSGLVELEDE